MWKLISLLFCIASISNILHASADEVELPQGSKIAVEIFDFTLLTRLLSTKRCKKTSTLVCRYQHPIDPSPSLSLIQMLPYRHLKTASGKYEPLLPSPLLIDEQTSAIVNCGRKDKTHVREEKKIPASRLVYQPASSLEM
jgi:hypothetical protein